MLGSDVGGGNGDFINTAEPMPLIAAYLFLGIVRSAEYVRLYFL